MELIFRNNTIQFDELSSVEEVTKKINELLSNQYYYSHMIVDGEEIYEEPDRFLLESFEAINTIEVVVKTVREFINELLLTAEGYLKNAIPEMIALTDGFYKNPTADNWNDFSTMLEGIQWLNQMIDLIDKTKERPDNWNECIKLAIQLQMELKNLEEAVVNIDHVLIADIIQYELLPICEGLQVEFNTTIDTEVERNDLN